MNCKIKKTAVLAPLAELVLGMKTSEKRSFFVIFVFSLPPLPLSSVHKGSLFIITEISSV